MEMIKKLRWAVLLVIPLFLSGCGGGYNKNDIKNKFCGIHINYQYCKCAFHGEFCDAIGMSKGEAKDYVYEEYGKWKDGGQEKFEQECLEKNGYMIGQTCNRCDADQVVENNRCVDAGEAEEEEIGEEEEEVSEENETCKYDSDCDAICEGSVKWKMGCNARTNTCEKTFDTDCSADVESFGEQSFPKICSGGECVRDEEGIQKAKARLESEKQMWIEAGKQINAVRPGINEAMLDANKNCINGIADMTNVAIMEFATRVASVLAGGIPDVAAMTASASEEAAGLVAENVESLAGGAVDYVGEALNRLYNYQDGEPVEEEKKLAPHEYIKLNCDLYQYFNGVQAESDKDLQTALDNAEEADRLLQELP
jgi:hypothetical protein